MTEKILAVALFVFRQVLELRIPPQCLCTAFVQAGKFTVFPKGHVNKAFVVVNINR